MLPCQQLSYTFRTYDLIGFFFFNDTATTEIYTLSLHDALPIASSALSTRPRLAAFIASIRLSSWSRSEEHTSELQSRSDIVCRLLLEKTKTCTEKFISGGFKNRAQTSVSKKVRV